MTKNKGKVVSINGNLVSVEFDGLKNHRIFRKTMG